MKKIANIAATLAMATAFCGFCSGVALNVTANAETTPAPTVSTSAVGTTPKVILSPGAFYNNSIEASAGSKVTKLTAAEEGQYFVENAWFANYSVGEELPKATTTRTGVTFLGWRYTVDGEPKVVGTMPAVTDDLYLYAHWSAGDVGSNPGVPDIPDLPGTDDILPDASSVVIKCSDGVIKITVKDSNGYVYGFSGVQMTAAFLHVYGSSAGDYTGNWGQGTFNQTINALDKTLSGITNIMIGSTVGQEVNISVSGLTNRTHITVHAENGGGIESTTTL